MKIFVQFVCAVFFYFKIHVATGSSPGVNPLLLQTQCCKQLPAVPDFQSCAAIKEYWPDSPSGYYYLGSTVGWRRQVYCHMDELCGTKGGWTRIAYLDMTFKYSRCPSGFKLYQSGEVRACGRSTSSGATCTSIRFPSHGTSYSQVCGRVVGYQYGSIDAIQNYNYVTKVPNDPNHNDINSYYVDGVSITHGYPRQHIWTLMAAYSDSHNHDTANCPCYSQGSTQSFVGNDYFCESGNPNYQSQSKLYTQDPLWDGKGCGSSEANCCSAAGLPWFNKVLNSTTTDYIELRVCTDQGTANEDVPVSFYDIYIK